MMEERYDTWFKQNITRMMSTAKKPGFNDSPCLILKWRALQKYHRCALLLNGWEDAPERNPYAKMVAHSYEKLVQEFGDTATTRELRNLIFSYKPQKEVIFYGRIDRVGLREPPVFEKVYYYAYPQEVAENGLGGELLCSRLRPDECPSCLVSNAGCVCLYSFCVVVKDTMDKLRRVRERLEEDPEEYERRFVVAQYLQTMSFARKSAENMHRNLADKRCTCSLARFKDVGHG